MLSMNHWMAHSMFQSVCMKNMCNDGGILISVKFTKIIWMILLWLVVFVQSVQIAHTEFSFSGFQSEEK